MARWLNGGFTWLQPQRAEQRNMSFGLTQALYTPRDNDRTDLVAEDRPHAAVLLASIGCHGRTGDRLDSALLRLGWVGPSVRSEEMQHAVHKVTGSKPFRGWSNQLHDEPIFQLQYEWTRRRPRSVQAGSGRYGWDTLGHGGASLGTLATGAIAGVQWRYGKSLPDDFGSQPLWAAGDGAAPLRSAPRLGDGWTGHVFVGSDLRWVLHNVVLDGNTYRDSHSVDRRPLVGEINYGFVLRKQRVEALDGPLPPDPRVRRAAPADGVQELCDQP